MADFRKLILVLAVLAIVAAPASAQLSCTARATPAQLRVEGVTELVGDTTMNCTNDTAQGIALEVIINDTNITNRITNAATNAIDANLFVAGNATPYVGRLSAGGTSVVWEGVQVPVAAASTQLIRISGIRVNASIFASQLALNQIQQVSETILVSGTDVLDVQNNVLNVGTARRGLLFSAINPADTDLFDESFQACTGENTGAADGTGSVNFRLRFQEGIAAAFKTQAQEFPTGEPTGGNLNATWLMAEFANVPAGVSIYVASTSTVPEGSTDVEATIRTTGVSTSTTTIGGVDYKKVTISSTGSGSATWAVTGNTDPNVYQQALIPVIISFPADISIPSGGITVSASVGGTFAPIAEVFTADEDSRIPRFVDTAVPQPVFSVAACVTNLLFPFVSNAAGFDTGIALVNTSTSNSTGASGTPPNQPFKTAPQTGTCTLYYFGVKSDGTVPGPQTTVPIGAATTSTDPLNKYLVAFALSQGGPAGATGSVASFNGYIIARCNFQFGHGYAFITDLGAQKLAQGYLALVIPDRGGARVAQPFTTASSSSGEQLIF